MDHPIREARLLPQYSALYPDLEPGVWVPACTLAEFVLERGLYQRRTGAPSRDRPLSQSHFEFRGGPSRAAGWQGPPERSADKTVGSGDSTTEA
jgi:hypothetical protein